MGINSPLKLPKFGWARDIEACSHYMLSCCCLVFGGFLGSIWNCRAGVEIRAGERKGKKNTSQRLLFESWEVDFGWVTVLSFQLAIAQQKLEWIQWINWLKDDQNQILHPQELLSLKLHFWLLKPLRCTELHEVSFLSSRYYLYLLNGPNEYFSTMRDAFREP